jgi:hypothetical protein
MPFPWITILRLILPNLPHVISSVRNIKNPQHPQGGSALQNDPLGRIEKLEKALELQSRINEELTTQLQQLRNRLQILTFVTLSGLIVVVVVVGILISR